MSSGREAVDVADLGDDQHRGVAPNAAELGQHGDAIIGLGLLLDLAGGLFDLAVKVADQRHQAVQPPPGRVTQRQRVEELTAAFASATRRSPKPFSGSPRRSIVN